MVKLCVPDIHLLISLSFFPKVKFRLISEIYNEKMELINEGEVTLAFMDAATGKPRRAPEEFTDILERTGKFG